MSTQSLQVVTYNTESGSRPGFHQHFEAFIAEHKPDVIALQEVHQAHDLSVPELYMPLDPGKRQYPMRLHLYYELLERYQSEYEFIFASHVTGVHDLENAPFGVDFGQVTMVRRQSWQVSYTRTGYVYGKATCFNTEHEGGTPCSKVAISLLLTGRENGRQVLITNVHGFWSRYGKVDIPARFEQNTGIAEQMEHVLGVVDTSFVLCVGDLNYRSDMQALKDLLAQSVFGAKGRVLNHDFAIKRTRTDHYPNWEQEPEADFMIASADLADAAVTMKSHMDVPSDHALLQAKFEIP